MAIAFGRPEHTALRPLENHGTGVGTITVPTGSSMVLVQPIGANVRVRLDGEDATTTVGFQVASGTSQFFPVAGASTIHIVAESGTPTVQYQFFL